MLEMNNFFVAEGVEQNPHRRRPQVVVIGNFDGVHRGHQALLAEAVQRAQKLKLPAVVLTFDPHPLEILRPPHRRLFSIEDQQEQLKASGAQGVVYLQFSRDFSELTAEQFMESLLEVEFQPRILVVGFNFRFGSGRKGTTSDLEKWGARVGCEVIVVPPFSLDSEPVSTSEIRKKLQAGDLEKVSTFLGRHFSLDGVVEKGESRGQKLGFPTANLHFERGRATPPWGVYATHTSWRNQIYDSVSHLGPLPTFEDEKVRLESHLLDFEGDLYGEKLKVEFVRKIRDIQKFSSVEALREQIGRDVSKAQEILRGQA